MEAWRKWGTGPDPQHLTQGSGMDPSTAAEGRAMRLMGMDQFTTLPLLAHPSPEAAHRLSSEGVMTGRQTETAAWT